MTQNHWTVLEYIRHHQPVSRKEIEESTGFGRSKTASLIKDLVEENLIEKTGSGPSTRYIVFSRTAVIH